MDFFTVKRIIGIGVIAAALLVVLGLYGYANGVRSEGIQREQAMTGQYKVNENELSTTITKIYQMVDIANLKSSKMDTILTHAVQGRYGTDGFRPGNGALFSAIQEAYPNADLSVYDRIMTAIESGYESFKNQQNKLADMVRAYTTWRYDGIVRSYFATKYFPSQMLEVKVNGKRYAGQEALAMIDQMVLTQEASAAFETGKMPSLDLKHR